MKLDYIWSSAWDEKKKDKTECSDWDALKQK